MRKQTGIFNPFINKGEIATGKKTLLLTRENVLNKN